MGLLLDLWFAGHLRVTSAWVVLWLWLFSFALPGLFPWCSPRALWRFLAPVRFRVSRPLFPGETRAPTLESACFGPIGSLGFFVWNPLLPFLEKKAQTLKTAAFRNPLRWGRDPGLGKVSGPCPRRTPVSGEDPVVALAVGVTGPDPGSTPRLG